MATIGVETKFQFEVELRGYPASVIVKKVGTIRKEPASLRRTKNKTGRSFRLPAEEALKTTPSVLPLISLMAFVVCVSPYDRKAHSYR